MTGRLVRGTPSSVRLNDHSLIHQAVTIFDEGLG
jgi:hypothetical protein